MMNYETAMQLLRLAGVFYYDSEEEAKAAVCNGLLWGHGLTPPDIQADALRLGVIVEAPPPDGEDAPYYVLAWPQEQGGEVNP